MLFNAFLCKFYMLCAKTEIVLANFADLAAAWENVGEVKSAVSEI